MKYIQSLIWFLAFNFFQYNWAAFEFTNIKCNSLDKSYVDFEYCFLKAVNRSYKYVSLKVNIFKGPINNANINIAVMKRLNGWKPFLYNVTFDGCDYMRRNKRNAVVDFLVKLAISYTNFNHTCPYDDFVFLEKLPISYLSNVLTNVLPVPSGEYALITNWFTDGKFRATVNAQCKLG